MNEPPASGTSAPPTGTDQPAPAQQSVRVAFPRSTPYVTYAIIGITVVAYLLQQVTNLTDLFIKSNDAIRAGEIWRLFTPMLLHGSILHIGFNMYALYIFGPGLERHFGRVRFLLLYVLAAFAGNVLSFLFTNAESLGASTAIFGLIAAEGIFLIQNRKLFGGQFRGALGNIVFIAAINLFLGISGTLPGVDNWGHVGGLLGGLIFSWFASPVYAIEGISPSYHLVDKRSLGAIVTGAALVVLIFGGLAMWGMAR